VKRSRASLLKTNRFASAWRRWRGRTDARSRLDDLPCIPVAAERVTVLSQPAVFRETLLTMIGEARSRILITTLYLQDDDAGRQVLDALYAAKAAQPQLEVSVFVDWHRAQRGLIGKGRSAGNAALYKEMASLHGAGVTIYGVPVQRREFMGVMHLKGLIVDDRVLYSGASLNDVYLHRHQRYRLDRYHLIDSGPLADSLANLLNQTIGNNAAVYPLDRDPVPRTVDIRNAIVRFRRVLAKARYGFVPGQITAGEVGITPLVGLGARDNELNAALLSLIERAEKHLVLFTPYFNLPGPIRRAVDERIAAGCEVTIILGDKTANDFYIPPDEPFKTIGALPYLYEANLRRYCQAHQLEISAGQLNIQLWRDADNTFHLKGMLVDDDFALLTGNNLNPRAWRLDLENGLLIHDPQKILFDKHQTELATILQQTTRLAHYSAIDTIDQYPQPVQRLIRRLTRVRAVRLVNQVL